MTISRQIDQEDKGERVPLKSKQLKDKGIVPLMTELVTDLRDHRAKQAEWGRGTPSDWVFSEDDGSHITHATFAYRFEARRTQPGLVLTRLSRRTRCGTASAR